MSILSDILKEGSKVQSNIQSGQPGSSNNGPLVFGIDPTKGTLDPNVFIYNAAYVLIWALGIAAVLTFIYAGVKYITAGGDSEKAESAKKIIIGSIIGILLIMGSYIIFNSAVATLSGQNTNQVLDQIYK